MFGRRLHVSEVNSTSGPLPSGPLPGTTEGSAIERCPRRGHGECSHGIEEVTSRRVLHMYAFCPFDGSGYHSFLLWQVGEEALQGDDASLATDEPLSEGPGSRPGT